jgi:hypothetical protein
VRSHAQNAVQAQVDGKMLSAAVMAMGIAHMVFVPAVLQLPTGGIDGFASAMRNTIRFEGNAPLVDYHPSHQTLELMRLAQQGLANYTLSPQQELDQWLNEQRLKASVTISLGAAIAASTSIAMGEPDRGIWLAGTGMLTSGVLFLRTDSLATMRQSMLSSIRSVLGSPQPLLLPSSSMTLAERYVENLPPYHGHIELMKMNEMQRQANCGRNTMGARVMCLTVDWFYDLLGLDPVNQNYMAIQQDRHFAKEKLKTDAQRIESAAFAVSNGVRHGIDIGIQISTVMAVLTRSSTIPSLGTRSIFNIVCADVSKLLDLVFDLKTIATVLSLLVSYATWAMCGGLATAIPVCMIFKKYLKRAAIAALATANPVAAIAAISTAAFSSALSAPAQSVNAPSVDAATAPSDAAKKLSMYEHIESMARSIFEDLSESQKLHFIGTLIGKCARNSVQWAIDVTSNNTTAWYGACRVMGMLLAAFFNVGTQNVSITLIATHLFFLAGEITIIYQAASDAQHARSGAKAKRRYSMFAMSCLV